MKGFICFFVISLMVFPQASFADPSQKVCQLEKTKGLDGGKQWTDKPISLEGLREHISEQGCEKGDLLMMEWYDKGIAYVCDLEKPTVLIGNGFRLCTYIGTLRQKRN